MSAKILYIDRDGTFDQVAPLDRLTGKEFRLKSAPLSSSAAPGSKFSNGAALLTPSPITLRLAPASII